MVKNKDSLLSFFEKSHVFNLRKMKSMMVFFQKKNGNFQISGSLKNLQPAEKLPTGLKKNYVGVDCKKEHNRCLGISFR